MLAILASLLSLEQEFILHRELVWLEDGYMVGNETS